MKKIHKFWLERAKKTKHPKYIAKLRSFGLNKEADEIEKEARSISLKNTLNAAKAIEIKPTVKEEQEIKNEDITEMFEEFEESEE